MEIWWGERDTLPPQPLLAHCVLAHSWHIKLPRTAKEVMEGGYGRIKPPFTLFTKLPKYLFSVKMIEKCKITSSFMRNYFVKIRSNEKVMHGSCKIVLNLVISPFAPVLLCPFWSANVHLLRTIAMEDQIIDTTIPHTYIDTYVLRIF